MEEVSLPTSSTSSPLAEDTHGLIVAKSDISTTGLAWSNSTTTVVGTSAGYGTGLSNSDKIMNSTGASSFSFAAYNARYYNGGGYSNWFLPSREELRKLQQKKDDIGNFQVPTQSGDRVVYWTSSESTQPSTDGSYDPDTCAHVPAFDGTNGDWANYKSPRDSTYPAYEHVRPVRYF